MRRHVGLALWDHTNRSLDQYADEADTTIANAIHEQLKKTRNRLTSAAFAISLGIMGYEDAGEDILYRAIAWKNHAEPAGYMSVALGLMRYAAAKESINRIVEGAKRKPLLLTQASIALGLLGDKAFTAKLIERLQQHKNTVAVHSALASALGNPSQHGAITQVGGLGGRPLPEEAVTLAEVLQQQGYMTMGVVSGPMLKRRFGVAQGFAYYSDDLRRADAVNELALEWLDRTAGRPFFLFLNYYDVHLPVDPPGYGDDDHALFEEHDIDISRFQWRLMREPAAR